MAAAPTHYVTLDIARFLAAFSVMLYHLAWHASHAPSTSYGIRAAIGTEVDFPVIGGAVRWGFLGVELFFLISGFIISVTAQGRTPFRFFKSRVVRLAPALWVFSLLALAITLSYSESPLTETLTLFWRSIILHPLGPWLDGVLWTLTVEVVFYMAILFLLIAGRLNALERLAQIWVLLCALLIAVALLSRAEVQLPAQSSGIAIFVESYKSRPLLITTGPYFALGVMLHGMLNHGVDSRRILFACVAFAGGFGSAYLTTDAAAGAAVWAVATLVTIGALVVEVKWSRRRSAPRERRTLQSFVRLIGLSAYPIYLVHNISGAWFMGRLIELGVSERLALFSAVCSCIAVSCAFATMLEPALQSRLRRALDSTFGILRSPQLLRKRR